MKKKYYYLIGVLVLICIVTILFLKFRSTKKVYLSEKYYNNGEFIDIASSEIDTLKDDTYVLYIYNNYCSFSVPCESIFNEYMTTYNIDFVSMKFEEFKLTKYYKKIKYAPSIIIIDKGKIVSYLNPEKDQDISKYQVIEDFTSWMNKYIYEK